MIINNGYRAFLLYGNYQDYNKNHYYCRTHTSLYVVVRTKNNVRIRSVRADKTRIELAVNNLIFFFF